jgi:hypothetical protein
MSQQASLLGGGCRAVETGEQQHHTRKMHVGQRGTEKRRQGLLGQAKVTQNVYSFGPLLGRPTRRHGGRYLPRRVGWESSGASNLVLPPFLAWEFRLREREFNLTRGGGAPGRPSGATGSPTRTLKGTFRRQ